MNEHYIKTLIDRSEINLLICKEISDLFLKIENSTNNNSEYFNQIYKPKIQFLRLVHHSSFLETVSILKTLLHPSNGEISLKDLPNVVLSELRNISDEFKSKGFLKIRNNLVDHKGKKMAKRLHHFDADNLVLPSVLESLLKIVQQVKNSSSNWYSTPYENRNAYEQILEGLKIIISELNHNI